MRNTFLYVETFPGNNKYETRFGCFSSDFSIIATNLLSLACLDQSDIELEQRIREFLKWKFSTHHEN